MNRRRLLSWAHRATAIALVATSGCAAPPAPPLDRGIPAAVSERRASTSVVFASATELARRIREGELSSVDVVRAFIAQIAAHNGAFNAVVLLDAKSALARAAEADAARARGESWGPLHGVPVTVKDTFEVRGIRTTAGHPSLAGHVPARDATLVALLRGAGAIVLAKTNLATLAMDMQTTNPLFGTTTNPWDPRRTPGGSSGGCATALATGMSPLSFGSDLAGSLRLPAHYTGVFAFRPSHGVVSLRGHVPPLPGEVSGVTRAMAVAGPLARSVEDLELAMEVLARPHASDPTVVPLRPLKDPPTSIAGLRVAWAGQLGGVPVSREITAAIGAFTERLRAAGAQVTRAEPPGFDYNRTWEAWGALVGMQGGYERGNVARWFGDLFVGGAVAAIPHQRRILEPISVARYMETLGTADGQAAALEAFLAGYDAWLVPVSSTAAIPHLAPSSQFGVFNVYDTPVRVDGVDVPYYVATQAYATLFAVTESPVVAIPVGKTGDGLPIGVQVVGRRYEDLRLLRVAKLLASAADPVRYPLAAR